MSSRRLGAVRVVQSFVCALGTLLAASLARADDRAEAVRLFDSAEQHLAEHDYTRACEDYAASFRLDPQLGALLHWADCSERAGRPASAWLQFSKAYSWAVERGDARAAYAKQRADALATAFARVSLEVPADIPNLELRCDDRLLARSEWSSLPLDPGVHHFEARAAGYATWTESLTVPSTGSVALRVPELEPTTPPRSARTALVAKEAAPQSAGARPTSFWQQPATAYATLGLGVAVLAVGVGFEMRRAVLLERRIRVCPSEVDCTPHEQELNDKLTDHARTADTVATVGLVSGAVIGAGGMLLLISQRRQERSSQWVPVLAPGFAGALLRGQF